MALFKIKTLVDDETRIETPRPTSDVRPSSARGAADLSTLVHYCRDHASGKTADSPAFTHVVGEPGEHERLSFAELDSRARAIAAEIQKRGGVGKPVLVVLNPGADYAASLFGCLYARAMRRSQQDSVGCPSSSANRDRMPKRLPHRADSNR